MNYTYNSPEEFKRNFKKANWHAYNVFLNRSFFSPVYNNHIQDMYNYLENQI